MLHTNKLGELLSFFAERVRLFQTADMSAHIQLGLWIDQIAPDLSLREKFILSCAPVSLEKPHESDYFLACVQSVCSGKARSLPPELDWLRSSSPKHLEEAEALSQDISLYAWLAGKFPHVFHEADIVPAFRSQVSRYIERALLTQAGYGSISKELLYQY